MATDEFLIIFSFLKVNETFFILKSFFRQDEFFRLKSVMTSPLIN